MDWQHVWDAFPVNRELIWLNNCGTTPAGCHTLKAVSRFLDGYSRRGILTETESYPELSQSIKTILAGLINCQPEELALIHNTSEGMNFVSHGVDLHSGDEIILLENEYPSNIYPWQHWGDKGIKILFAPMAPTPSQFLQALTSLITPHTRLISLSAVHWCTGMPLPISEIGALCRNRGIDFVVDGAQGVVMQPIDVKKAGIDFMSFSAWKWLMGPLGLGVFYISEEKIAKLNPIFMGTESVVNDQEYLPYKTELKPTADRFAFSTASIVDWVYFKSSLEFLASIGFRVARGRIFQLNAYLETRLADIGFEVLAGQFPAHPTGITVCEKPGVPSKRILSLLIREGIVPAERLGRIRFSPHIYNSPEQIDRVIRVLQEA